MPDFGRPDSSRFGSGPQDPSLDAVRRADSFVDALADGRSVIPQDPADAELAALLGGWRDEMRWPPATGLIAEADAVAALNAGLAEKRPGVDRERRAVTAPRGSRRGLSTIGAAAAAVLCIGGFGAVVAGSGPGDPLYGVRTMFFGAKQVRDDQVGLAAKTELNQVQDLIAQGNWEQAQDKLVAVSTQVATIDDVQQKQELLDQFNDLSAKVVERDPQATAPPGVVYTVPPSAVALVPAVEPTSTPAAPSLTTSTTPTTPTTTAETATSASTSATAASTTPTSESPGSTSSASSAEETSLASSAAETSTADPQSQSATTPTSAAPTTSATAATPTSTAAPSSAEQATTAVTTTAEAPRAVSSTTVASAPETTVSQSVSQPASVAATSVPQSAPAPTGEPLPTVAITTTLVPVPAG
jgi:hypothetical protein